MNKTLRDVLNSALLLGNIINLFWSVWLTLEQINTYWTYGTSLEIGVLYPYICQIVFFPFVLVTSIIIIIIISFFNKKRYIA